jgi:hypothetical protein
MTLLDRRQPNAARSITGLVTFAARHSTLLWALILALAVVAIYGSSLAYPFFWVDPIDIGLAGSRSIPTIFTSSQGYLYYRPLTFVLWKLLFALEGSFDPFAFHLVHVLTHLINTWLMFALARRLFRNKSTLLPGLAALLFAWYPFSHQTVTWVISPQVQAMTFMLGSAILYYDGRLQHSRQKILWSLILLAIALPFQENAISFGFVIAALEVFVIRFQLPSESPNSHSARATVSAWLKRLSRWPLAHIGLCLAFAALWFIIPKDPDSAIARFEPAVGWYLLQGLIWPVAGAVGPWRTWFPTLSNPAWQPLIVVAPIVLLFLIGAFRYARKLSLLAFGLAWYAVMIAPIWATRGFGYVGTSPRILYVASGGAIVIWIGLLAIDFKSVRANHWWKAGLAILSVAIVLQSAAFLGVRKALSDASLPAIWDVVQSGSAAGDEAHLLYVNVPDQITPYWREYPVGFFRAVLMPVSVDLGQYAELQTGVRPQTQSLTVPALAHLENYPYQVDMRGPAADQTQLDAAIRSSDDVFTAKYQPDGHVRVVEAGNVRPGTALNRVALFDSRLELVSAAIDSTPDQATLTLTWDCLGEFDPQETIFVHALDASGQLAAQADGDPLQNLYPLSNCQPGEQIVDIHYLALPAGSYTLRVGVYNRSTNERLAAIDAAGNSIAEDAFTIGQVTR